MCQRFSNFKHYTNITDLCKTTLVMRPPKHHPKNLKLCRKFYLFIWNIMRGLELRREQLWFSEPPYYTSIFTRITSGKLKEFCRSHADLSYSFSVYYSELRSMQVFSKRSSVIISKAPD